jgi:hypothetical protein
MEEILDLIHTNQLLERFIQSENFRASQDQILYLKQKFLLLQKRYQRAKQLRESFQASLTNQQSQLAKNQEKYQELSN